MIRVGDKLVVVNPNRLCFGERVTVKYVGRSQVIVSLDQRPEVLGGTSTRYAPEELGEERELGFEVVRGYMASRHNINLTDEALAEMTKREGWGSRWTREALEEYRLSLQGEPPPE